MLHLPEHGPKGFSPATVPGFFLRGAQGTPEIVCKRVNSAAMPGQYSDPVRLAQMPPKYGAPETAPSDAPMPPLFGKLPP